MVLLPFNSLDSTFALYLSAWLMACLVALVLYLSDRTAYLISRQDYWRFLAAPWKLTTFAIAAIGMIVVAPYSGDPTWDYFDAAFMSIFCFTTAPWAIGVVYRSFRGKSHWREIYVMACAWMFTVSWSYDIYILLKTGFYPATWLSNIVLSSVLYIAAGLLWNLEHQEGHGVILGFRRDSWPQPEKNPAFARIAGYALIFMMLVAVMVLAFVIPFLQEGA